jgi:NAD(P)-dependent dehydrogenase (short-subunit alcohol dehydrogenase family)
MDGSVTAGEKVAIVTGAAGGIGAAITRRFLADGFRVVAGDLNRSGLATLATSGPTDALLTLELDVTSEASCDAMAATVERRFGRLDVLINNAGLFPLQRFEDITYQDWRRVITINLDSVFLVTKSILPLLKRSESGRIVNISSGSTFKGTAAHAHYVSAKMGVLGLTRVMATEFGEFGITANAVTPGLTATEAVTNSFPPQALAAAIQSRPLKRAQSAEDLVGTVAFLASPDAAFLTGQTINVDGGSNKH